MPDFDKTLSALGHFWPANKPDNVWPGRVYIDTFPRATLHCIGRSPGDGSPPRGRLTMHGLTEDNRSVTMFEAAAYPGGVSYNNRSTTQSTNITANYMLMGYDHFDDSATVRRISFGSSVAEHVFRLLADPSYGDIRHRNQAGFEIPILHRQAVSFLDPQRRIRVRAFRSTIPNITIEPSSNWVIDFLKMVTPREAIDTLFNFRVLLAVLCGEAMDLWNVRCVHRVDSHDAHSSVYFADPVVRPTSSRGFPQLPLLDIGRNQDLFRRVMSAWMDEPQAKRVARGAFATIVQDKGTLRFSHLRELVTIIEMQEAKAGTAPLEKEQADKLRGKLRRALDEFSKSAPGDGEWLEVIRSRLDNINYHNAKVQFSRFMSKLPPKLIAFIAPPDNFAHEVIELRNTLVHDIARITVNDQNKLAFFLAQLKAMFAISDAVSLGAAQDEIQEGSQFLSAARQMPINFFTGAERDLEL